MLPSLPDLQKERGFPFTLSRKKYRLRFNRESTPFALPTNSAEEPTKNAGKSQDINENKQLRIDILTSPRMLMKNKVVIVKGKPQAVIPENPLQMPPSRYIIRWERRA